jgi:hypothetical protein
MDGIQTATVPKMRCGWGNYSLLGYVGGNIALEFLYGGPHSLLSRIHLNNPHAAPAFPDPTKR